MHSQFCTQFFFQFVESLPEIMSPVVLLPSDDIASIKDSLFKIFLFCSDLPGFFSNMLSPKTWLSSGFSWPWTVREAEKIISFKDYAKHSSWR